jgi:fatty-acyl-CoA synthase
MALNAGRYVPGLMMETQLNIPTILRRLATVYPETVIYSRYGDLTIVSHTNAELYIRVLKLMQALKGLGVRPGDTVASFAYNSHRHLELYYAVPAIGAILHTVNIRLFAHQKRYVLEHGEARVVFTDESLLDSLNEAILEIANPPEIVVMPDSAVLRSPLPPGAHAYEALLETCSPVEAFIDISENTAASLCYTSGTTGEPKGVLYSHRSLYLHSLGCCMADSLGITQQETLMPVVPMFHANAWGLPYSAGMTGAPLVFPGSHLSARPLAELIEACSVQCAAGVPTVWNLLFQHLVHHPQNISSLRRVICGGAAAPRALIELCEKQFGIDFLHAWGMTETSPVGSACVLKSADRQRNPEERYALKTKQGLAVNGVEMRIIDDAGNVLPHDGTQVGELLVRGPWVARQYYKRPDQDPEYTPDGWFKTGDVASIDASGYMLITDRSRDMIKSRGEWIPSLGMENALASHPSVLEAAVAARPDSLRGEAPVAFVVLKPGVDCCEPKQLLEHLRANFERWQLPRSQDIHFIEALPRTSVGKVDKKELRRLLREPNALQDSTDQQD